MQNRLRSFWSGRSPRARSILRYVLPIALFWAFVFADWLRLHYNGISTPADSRALSERVAIASVISAVVMHFRKGWTIQDLCWVGLLLAGASLKYIFIAGHGPQPPAEWFRDLTYATFEVASYGIAIAMVLYGLLRFGHWIRSKRKAPI